MQNSILDNGKKTNSPANIDTTADKIQFSYDVLVAQGQKSSIQKIGGYTVSLNPKIHLLKKVIKEALYTGYDQLLQDQINACKKKFGKCQTSLLKEM
jgi:maltose phosphorylase